MTSSCTVTSLMGNPISVISKVLHYGRDKAYWIVLQKNGCLGRMARPENQATARAIKKMVSVLSCGKKRHAASLLGIQSRVTVLLEGAKIDLEKGRSVLPQESIIEALKQLAMTKDKDVLRLTGMERGTLRKQLIHLWYRNKEALDEQRRCIFVMDNWTLVDWRWATIHKVNPFDHVRLGRDGCLVGKTPNELKNLISP